MTENEKKPEKVFFTHDGYIGSAADCFIKRKEPLTQEEAESMFEIDYWMPDCKYVVAFLEHNREYQYVGSSDDAHDWGWGMELDEFEEIECPQVDDSND